MAVEYLTVEKIKPLKPSGGIAGVIFARDRSTKARKVALFGFNRFVFGIAVHAVCRSRQTI